MCNHKNLLFRADASTKIGSGHLMRCLALAQAWRLSRGKAIFAVATDIEGLQKRLQEEGITVYRLPVSLGSLEDAVETIALAKQLGANWLVVDGYHFATRYQQQIKAAGLKLLFIDDYGHAEHYYADLVLNQNVCADESLYSHREPYTQLLLGTRYVLLRQEFLEWRDWQRKIPEVARKILVTLGGSDPDNVTLKVIQALEQVEIQDLEVLVVVGGSNSHYEQLQALVQQSSLSISLQRNVTNMPELMAWADIAIAAGGSTNWELAFRGLPSLIIVTAENQKAIAQKLDELGAAMNLGWHDKLSTTTIASLCDLLITQVDKRIAIKEIASRLVDGKGVERIIEFIDSDELKLRPVNENDCQLLWEWANEPQVRNASFSSEFITWEIHQKWFSRKMKDPNCYLFIALDDTNRPIGQARFEVNIETEEAEISLSVCQNKQGCGFGTLLIKKALEEFSEHSSVKVIKALIKPNNSRSIRAFERAGFYRVNKIYRNNCPALYYKKSIIFR